MDKGTEILLKYLDFPSEETFLDLGAGYGPIGLCRKRTRNINKHTIYFSRDKQTGNLGIEKNIRNHGIKNYKLVSGDFVEKAKQLKEQNIRFKAIYSNPPNRLGLDLVFKMLHAAIDFMDEDGFMQYVIKNPMVPNHLQGESKSNFRNKRYIALQLSPAIEFTR